MNERPFISIKSAIPDVFSTLDPAFASVGDILEWSSKAMAQMNVYEFYEEKIAIRQVINYESYLPCGLLQVNQILYKSDFTFTEEDGSNCNCSNDVYKAFEDKYLLDSEYCRKNWFPLRASTNNFLLTVVCANSENLTTNCEHEFTILPSGKIVTSFKQGWIMISYLSAVLDDDGNFMIPDDQELIEALRLYCMARIWERRWNMKEDGSEGRFQYYITKWGLFKNMVRGKFKLPTAEQRQNIIDYSTSLLPKKDRYYSYFGTLGVPDHTFF